MPPTPFGWNSPRGRQEQSLSWLRKRLQEDAVLLLSDHDSFHKKYPPHTTPAQVVMEELLQKYVDFDGEDALEGPVERYYVTTATSHKFSLRIAIVDRQRVGEYFVHNQESMVDHPLVLVYEEPMVRLAADRKPYQLVFFLSKPQEWSLKGPGTVFGGPVVEVSF